MTNRLLRKGIKEELLTRSDGERLVGGAESLTKAFLLGLDPEVAIPGPSFAPLVNDALPSKQLGHIQAGLSGHLCPSGSRIPRNVSHRHRDLQGTQTYYDWEVTRIGTPLGHKLSDQTQ